jgi:DNA polymerase-3 subunit epsilon
LREIILDTETTGLDPLTGDRIVEVGCIEILHRKKTGNKFHHYINPQRKMSEEAFKVHGISDEMLIGKPYFEHIGKELFEFIGDANIIAHNAPFDVKFLNFEFKKMNLSFINPSKVIDTLVLARKKFPGAKANLNALCQRFNIDLSRRDKHGALLDAELLLEVYIELTGGAQNSMIFDMKTDIKNNTKSSKIKLEARKFEISNEEKENHIIFVKKFYIQNKLIK